MFDTFEMTFSVTFYDLYLGVSLGLLLSSVYFMLLLILYKMCVPNVTKVRRE